jgi:signal transduction histidine kinase
MSRERLRRWWRALRFLAADCLASAGSLCLVIAGLVLLPIMLLSGGRLALPDALRTLRNWSDRARTRAGRFRRIRIAAPRAVPETPGTEESVRLAFSQTTGRDATWLIIHALPMFFASLITLAIVASVLTSLAVPFYWWTAPPDDPIAAPYPVTSWWGAAWMPLVALGYALISWWLVPAVAQFFAWLDALLLAPTRSMALSERVDALSTSRAAALAAHAAELRRIERDLHDGAQNRLVSVVMMLGLAERSLETSPGDALPQLRRAQEAAADALAGLRETVHDLYPPVLDELGLEGALSALAGRSAVPCTLELGSLGRLPAAVESATYFIVAEALTNVNKYSEASRVHARVSLQGEPDERIIIAVEDDGIGGAVEHPGGGLAGIRRRSEAFEGTLSLESPPGGPTRIRAELPCAW